MSNDTPEAFVPKPLEQIPMFWLDTGAPVFIGTDPDICKHVEAHGFQIYYLMCTEVFDTIGNNNVKMVERRPQIFKVFTSILGRAVIPIGAKEIKFAEQKADAWFTLPKIPYYLVQKMDDFFRHIEDTIHTESILLLTYDSTKTGPEGWGVLVPEQENTGTDCDYKPESVVNDKPDHVYMVGSAHSHPNMPAYASGTDHKDQDGNDGLHITFGWQRSVNHGLTQHHIELQVGGTSFPFKAEQVFDDVPVRVPDEEVKEWAKKVTKKSFNTQGSHSSWQNSHSTKTNSPTKPSGTGGTFSDPSKSVKVPGDCPNPNLNIIIGEVNDADIGCPFCQAVLITIDRKKRRCMCCHQYLCLEGEQLEDVVEARVKAGVYSSDIDTVKDNPDECIYIWRRISTPEASTAPADKLYQKVWDPKGKSLAVG